jgi:magnesium transporter
MTPMIRVALLRDGRLEQGGVALIDAWAEDRHGKLWVDIEGSPQEEVEPLLEERFAFHELAAEDCFSSSTLPKYDPFPEYDFMVFRSLNLDLIEHGVATSKLAVFLSRDYLFTIHTEPMLSTESVRQRLPQDQRMLDEGTDFLLYNILDALIDLHFPLIDEIESMVDEIQDLIFRNPSQQLLDSLLNLKKDLNTLRRYSLPQRDLLNQISRGESRFITPEHRIYYRDLYDHLFRITESIDVERDLVAGTMEAYLSVQANKLNEIVKVLTVFSAIMLPLNLIAAIYGMNFVHMPELNWRWGYFWALGLMAVVAVSMLIFFARNNWLWGKKDLQRLRRHSYKALTRPVRMVRVAAKKAAK